MVRLCSIIYSSFICPMRIIICVLKARSHQIDFLTVVSTEGGSRWFDLLTGTKFGPVKILWWAVVMNQQIRWSIHNHINSHKCFIWTFIEFTPICLMVSGECWNPPQNTKIPEVSGLLGMTQPVTSAVCPMMYNFTLLLQILLKPLFLIRLRFDEFQFLFPGSRILTLGEIPKDQLYRMKYPLCHEMCVLMQQSCERVLLFQDWISRENNFT